MSTTKKLIVLLGPTASGKTSLSIEIAQKLNTEILSCDSRQFYKELKIGAAPPSKEELAIVNHHFIHHLSIKENYSIGQFEKDAIAKITELFKAHNYLLLVGGSGLYIDAICNGIDNIPNISNNVREKINNEYEKNGITWLQEKIKKIDPEFYKSVDINNPQRLKRCYEVFHQTGKRFSTFHKKEKKKRNFEIIKIGIKTDREQLYKKINTRVDKMIKNGLVNEAELLKKFREKNALNTVGYKELFNYFDQNIELDIAIDEIKKNTRRLAKRQLTWFRKDKNNNLYLKSEKNEIIEAILR